MASKNKTHEITVKGIVTPVEWDEEENVTAVLLEGDDEEAYYIESNTQGDRLLEHVDAKPTAVIDHHTTHGPRYRIRFRDIRPKMAATATIASLYLKEQEGLPTPELAGGNPSPAWMGIEGGASRTTAGG